MKKNIALTQLFTILMIVSFLASWSPASANTPQIQSILGAKGESLQASQNLAAGIVMAKKLTEESSHVCCNECTRLPHLHNPYRR